MHLSKLAGWRGVVLGIVLVGLGDLGVRVHLQHGDRRMQRAHAVAHRARRAACGGLGRGGTRAGDRRRLADRLGRPCRSLTTLEGLIAERRGCVSRWAGLSLGPGAILRPTPGSGAHAAGRSGGKGSLEPSGCRSVLALSRRRRRERETRGRRHEGKHEMTTQRSFKRLVRTRMRRPARLHGGESHAAVGRRPTRSAAGSLRSRHRMRHLRANRPRLEKWFDQLDEWGAADKTHREIARRVADQFGVEPRVGMPRRSPAVTSAHAADARSANTRTGTG